MLLVDSILLVAILFASFFIRLGHWNWIGGDLMWTLYGAPIIAIPIFVRFGLYRNIIRFIGFSAGWSMLKAISLYSLLWGIIGFMAAVDGIPRSVILINWLLLLIKTYL